MKTLLKPLLLALFVTQLISCGGGTDMNGNAAQPARQLAVVRTQAAVASDYFLVVEQLYIAYFGRPADTTGLSNFEQQMLQLGAPTDIQSLIGAYESNSGIRALIDSFSNSTESQALYTGDNSSVVDTIYQNVLGRSPDADGKAFWVNALDSGSLSRPNASLSIMAGALVNSSAQGQQDALLVNHRVTVSGEFTTSLNSDSKISAYSGNAAAATARAMLASVNADTDPGAFQTTVDSTIASLLASAVPSFAQVRTIINARCITCHSGSNAPLGIQLDIDANVHRDAQAIYTQVVVTQAMPLGNATGMTQDERNVISAWFLGGAN